MNSEYANLNAYDSIQVHGGSGYMLEYACQRLYRDARITSINAAPPNNSFSKIWLRLIAQVRHSKWHRLPVCTTFRSCLHSVSLKFSSSKQFLGAPYEGTTQLQTVAALPHITTGTYSQMLEELEAGEVAAEYESLKARAKAMDAKFNEAIEVVKAANNNEFTDLCSRHLYAVSRKRLVLTSRVGESEAISYVLFCVRAERSHKAANCVMSQLMLRDATKAPELFEKSMKVYLNLAERACAEPVEAKLQSTTTL